MSNGNGKKIGAVAVIGGGIGGMQAALDLANSGLKVYLVESSTAIGGHMAQLDKTFPTNDCSMCTISPKLIEVDKHENIEILTKTEVLGLEGEPGSFRLKVLMHPRFVNLKKCNACGDCIEKCPVLIPSEFEEKLSDRTIIHKLYPQAIPGAVAISKVSRPPCVLTCPAGVNGQAYMALTAKGRFLEALEVIRRNNPFPSVCGRVCHHPCEAECNRKELDEAVAINPVKRFLSDWAIAHEDSPIEQITVDHNKPKVAIVGAGPAGLACALDLVKKGYPVTVFEAEEKAGGMMRWGIPEYRLPREILDYDINRILSLPIELKTGVKLGKDFTLTNLKTQGYKAVFLGLGAPKSRYINIPGADLKGIYGALDFLRDVNSGKRPKLGNKVVIIGGGNVAIDAAMCAKRLGAGSVELFCLESNEEMPAHKWEIEDACSEGISINCSWGPKEFIGEGGKVTGLTFKACTCVFDEDKKFNPKYDESILTQIDADTIILAIGQAPDADFLAKDGLELTRGWIKSDPLTLETNVAGVFAGGDAVTGPKSVVEAIEHGHRAAESIERYLTGISLKEGREKEKSEPAPLPQYKNFPKLARHYERKLSVDQRKGFEEINFTLTEEEAIAEAMRCLQCGLCCECLACVAACPAEAIDHQMLPEIMELDVGAVIATCGFEPFDAELRGEYGYGRYQNVVTALQFERVLSASGPYQGHVVRPSDHKEPKRVAWIQCVGSRDKSRQTDYCSSVCCMYAIKEAIMAVDHAPGLEATIFYNDIRAYGKGFEFYYENSKNIGVKFMRGLISTVKEDPKTKNIIVRYFDDKNLEREETFDMLVLSTGLKPPKSAIKLAQRLDIELNRFGFVGQDAYNPALTSRKGVYVAGAFEAPMDIPETVMTASGAASCAMELLGDVRRTLVKEKTYPPEHDVSAQEPRIGVFICHCGSNIARVVDVKRVVEYAKTLPNVVYAETNLYTCSTDTQIKIKDTIKEHNINRVIVASCTPRTHEPLFQDTIREAGLNKYLFEMANIRDQDSWVHYNDPARATFKAMDLVRMAVARAKKLKPLQERVFSVQQSALVVGAGAAGLACALSIANQGFECYLVEREKKLGGNAQRLKVSLENRPAAKFVEALIDNVKNHPKIHVLTNAEIAKVGGHVGNFEVKVKTDNGNDGDIKVGAIVLATGGEEYKPTEYLYGQSERVMTLLDFSERFADSPQKLKAIKQAVFIQCVGSREKDYLYCSRVCCQHAIKDAILIKQNNPDAQVAILFRDIRTYGFHELDYQKARDLGVLFIRFDVDNKPEVTQQNGKLKVKVTDDALGIPLEFEPDVLILSSAIRPRANAQEVASTFKVPLNPDRFFLEAHMKLRPLDFPSDGIFVCGLAHAPKNIAESLRQAKGAAARAATIISKEKLTLPAVISVVDQELCAACLTCVRLCPYEVPKIVRVEGLVGREWAAYIEPALCQGCGVCASVCPRKAIVTYHYEDDQVVSKVEVLFDTEDFERTLGWLQEKSE